VDFEFNCLKQNHRRLENLTINIWSNGRPPLHDCGHEAIRLCSTCWRYLVVIG